RPGGAPAEEVPERFVGLVVSGGHTSLFGVADGRVSTLAETRDDAMGETFDKLGKRLGLAYPQGPRVDELAERGDAARRPLPVPGAPGDQELFFSYSGLKSQAILELERLGAVPRGGAGPDSAGEEFPAEVLDLLAGFRAAAVEQLLDRVARLHRRAPIPTLAVSGGVAANRLLRLRLAEWAERQGVALRLVPLEYAGDNAAMIGWAAIQRERRGVRDDPRSADAASRIAI
ncbi:MAG TPA: hypothetical protein VFE44_02265, partial [Thermoanaerobaculia bacterium]|nr:hypothetical protein [Thermoanaerobaculia bacterium]